MHVMETLSRVAHSGRRASQRSSRDRAHRDAVALGALNACPTLWLAVAAHSTDEGACQCAQQTDMMETMFLKAVLTGRERGWSCPELFTSRPMSRRSSKSSGTDLIVSWDRQPLRPE
jgi:hypothetical protein